LVVDTELLQCNGTAERDAAMMMAERVNGIERITLAADCNGPQNLDRNSPFLRWWAALKMKESQCPERARITRPA
jgi:hypothetical protein